MPGGLHPSGRRRALPLRGDGTPRVRPERHAAGDHRARSATHGPRPGRARGARGDDAAGNTPQRRRILAPNVHGRGIAPRPHHPREPPVQGGQRQQPLPLLAHDVRDRHRRRAGLGPGRAAHGAARGNRQGEEGVEIEWRGPWVNRQGEEGAGIQ